MYKNFIKLLLDFFISILLLIILAPLFIIITFVLIIINKGNPFFFQLRPGKNEKIFKIIKFKTMTDEKDKNGNLLPDDKRLTRFGKFVRKTSLDEIPQFINVLNGSMSLIGPRPLLIEYLSYYTEREKMRHFVRPGITGYAQVNGRNNLEWSQRLELDVWYVENLSFIVDLKIFFKTINNIVIRKDVVVIPSEKYKKLNESRKIVKL